MREHPDDRTLRVQAENEAALTIGRFWRRRWRRFVALVQTYSDVQAEHDLQSLREEFWGQSHEKGDPPTPPGRIRK